MVIALGLLRQQKAIQLQQEVNKTTNELLLRNSEMLKTNTVAIAKENEKSFVEAETLKRTHDNLIATIQEVIQIQAEGHKKRQEVESELSKLDQELKLRLTALVANPPR